MEYEDTRPEEYPKPRKVKDRISSVRLDQGMSLQQTIDVLSKWKKNHGKKYSETKLFLEHDYGDDNTLESNHLVLYGCRCETKEEMKIRLERWAHHFLRDRETHSRMVKAYEQHLAPMLKQALKRASPVAAKRHEYDIEKIKAGDLSV